MTFFRDMDCNDIFVLNENNYYSNGTSVSHNNRDYLVMNCCPHKHDITVYLMPKDELKQAMVPLYAVGQLIDDEIDDEQPDLCRLKENISRLIWTTRRK